MTRGLLSDYFEAVAVKKLSAVEADPERSHQHEFAAGHLKKMFGTEDRPEIPARYVWLGDEEEGIAEDGTVSWYDSRRQQPHRSSEWRLYYTTNGVTALMKEGDSFFVATRKNGSVMVIITPKDSTIESQLLWLFDLKSPVENFDTKDIPKDKLDFATRYILDELQIEPEEPEADLLDTILEKFGEKFPGTAEFSELARTSLTEVNALDDPDAVLMAWIEREELLFRRLERRVVTNRLKAGFVAGEDADVDGFIAFSLSVHNRRKSRAGRSLEHHLEAIFSARKLEFARGAKTEKNNKPDFLFPSAKEYHNLAFVAAKLTMLGAKSTCKDRWRQVLTEAARIPEKHLLTLEPGISEQQTDEMKAQKLQLVLPKALHETYRPNQQAWLFSLAKFIDLIQKRRI